MPRAILQLLLVLLVVLVAAQSAAADELTLESVKMKFASPGEGKWERQTLQGGIIQYLCDIDGQRFGVFLTPFSTGGRLDSQAAATRYLREVGRGAGITELNVPVSAQTLGGLPGHSATFALGDNSLQVWCGVRGNWNLSVMVNGTKEAGEAFFAGVEQTGPLATTARKTPAASDGEPSGGGGDSYTVGKIIGGVVGSAIASFCVWWFVVRPRQRAKAAQADGDDDGGEPADEADEPQPQRKRRPANGDAPQRKRRQAAADDDAPQRRGAPPPSGRRPAAAGNAQPARRPSAPGGARPTGGGARPPAPGGNRPPAPGGARPPAPGGARPPAPGGARPPARPGNRPPPPPGRNAR